MAFEYHPSTLSFNTHVEDAIGYIDEIKQSIDANQDKYTELHKNFPEIKWKNFLANLEHYRKSLTGLKYAGKNIKSEQVSTKTHRITHYLQLMYVEFQSWVDPYPAVFVVDNNTYGVSTLMGIMKKIRDSIGDTDSWPKLKKHKKPKRIGRKFKESRVQRARKHADPGRGVHLKPGSSPDNPMFAERPLRARFGNDIKVHPEPADEDELGEEITNIVMTKLHELGV